MSCTRTPEQKRRDERIALGAALFTIALTLFTVLSR